MKTFVRRWHSGQTLMHIEIKEMESHIDDRANARSLRYEWAWFSTGECCGWKAEKTQRLNIDAKW